MIRAWLTMIGFVPLILLVGSQKEAVPRTPVPFAAITIEARAVVNPVVETKFPLAFIKAWSLSSANRDFGSISAMMRDSSGFTAISDHGAVTRFKIGTDGVIFNASIAPLPRGCALDERKTSRDAESIARDPATREVLIGLEWSNALCRSNAGLTKAIRRAVLPEMRSWPILSGAEAMVTLRDGRTIVFAEQAAVAGETSPVLLVDQDPTLPSANVTRLSYRAPRGFKPTDAAQLPDGRLMVVNRRHQFPLTFKTVLTLVTVGNTLSGKTLVGHVVAELNDRSIAENYEAIAVSQNSARTFVWVMSDDNFIALQSTNLLLFELMSAKPTTSN